MSRFISGKGVRAGFRSNMNAFITLLRNVKAQTRTGKFRPYLQPKNAMSRYLQACRPHNLSD